MCLLRFFFNSYVNMPIVFGDLFLFCFVLFCFSFYLMTYILLCSLTTRREEIDRERKRLSNIQELKLL